MLSLLPQQIVMGSGLTASVSCGGWEDELAVETEKTKSHEKG